MSPVRRVVAAVRPAMLGGSGVVVLVALLGPAAPAGAAATPCVGVVVDGRLAGGSVRTACAVGDPRSGLDALTKAGISYAFVPRQPGQVCQLDGLPACSDTGADTYWSYWWRAKGSSRWVYATTGAGTHDPDPGDTEAWVWQDGGKVEPPDIAFTRICPQASTAPRTSTPTATAHPSSRPTSTGDAEPVPDASTSPKAGSSVRTRSPTSKPATSSASAQPSSGSATTSAAAPSSASATPAGAASSTGGSGSSGDDSPPWSGLAVGAVLVGGLGGAAALRARRGSS